jgi:hypothetical protein
MPEYPLAVLTQDAERRVTSGRRYAFAARQQVQQRVFGAADDGRWASPWASPPRDRVPVMLLEGPASVKMLTITGPRYSAHGSAQNPVRPGQGARCEASGVVDLDGYRVVEADRNAVAIRMD